MNLSLVRVLVPFLTIGASACGAYGFEWNGGALGGLGVLHEADGTAVGYVRSGAGGELYSGEPVHVHVLGARAVVLSSEDVLADGEPVGLPPEALEVLVALDPASVWSGRSNWGGSWQRPSVWSYRVVPAHPIGAQRGRVVDFRVLAISRAEADLVALKFLAADVKAGPPAGVSVGLYLVVQPASGWLLVSHASIEPPTWASLRVGPWSHAGLPGTQLVHVGPWSVVTFRVPPWAVGWTPILGADVQAETFELRQGGASFGGMLRLSIAGR